MNTGRNVWRMVNTREAARGEFAIATGRVAAAAEQDNTGFSPV
jgi:hypothetical protein